MFTELQATALLEAAKLQSNNLGDKITLFRQTYRDSDSTSELDVSGFVSDLCELKCLSEAIINLTNTTPEWRRIVNAFEVARQNILMVDVLLDCEEIKELEQENCLNEVIPFYP